MRRIHVCLDVRGALMNYRPRDLASLFVDANGRRLNAREAKAALLDELAKGHLKLPVGEACGGFSFTDGCPGHDIPEDDAVWSGYSTDGKAEEPRPCGH